MRKWGIFIIFFIVFFVGCNEFILKKQREIRNEHNFIIESIDVFQFIGKDLSHAVQKFGSSYETGPSRFGYEWVIFNKNPEKYLQIGHYNSKIVTVFILGQSLNDGFFAIGNKYDEIAKYVPMKNSIVIQDDTGEYRLELTDDDVKQRPLVQLTDDVYAQLYFDRFLNQLVAIRLLDKETLLKHRPYRIVYRGSLIEVKKLDKSHQKLVDEMNVKQIYYITNVLRKRYGKTNLFWNDAVATVAYQHSKDMKVNQFFDHHSPTNGNLEQRLEKQNITYFLAGENIAAEYPDGIAAVIGWLNSEGHRKTMLHENFTHIGIGVYDTHYTQNFIKR